MLARAFDGYLSDTVAYTHTPDDTNNPFRFFDLTRVESNPHIGTTNLFRHPRFFDRLATQINAWDEPHTPRILAAPCCVGTETYSLAAAFKKAGCFDRFPNLKIAGFDLSAEFGKAAKVGRYPRAMAERIHRSYRDYFNVTDSYVEVTDDLKNHVTILAPRDLTKPLRLKPFDIVITSNLLMHLKDDTQKCNLIHNICGLAKETLCLNNLVQDERRNNLLFNRNIEKAGFAFQELVVGESIMIFRKRDQAPYPHMAPGHA